ncbi:dipeptidase PepV [Roseburia hominis]
MSYEALNKKMMEMQEEIIASIQQNMRIESVRGEAKPGAPYGEGPKAALDDLLALGEKLGFQTGNADNRVGWIEYGEGEEMVGILGHLDVVPAGEGWKYPPFGAEIHDGELWGRGILDDKGPVIAAVYALKAIRDLNLPIDRRIRVLFGTDEECGSSCVKHYVENGYELPTIGFTPDAEFPAIFCEKGTSGFIAGEKMINEGKIKVESFSGGMAANVVTPFCKLVVCGPLKVTPAEGVTVREEEGKTIVEAVGVSAHGSTPQLGVNAAIRLLNAVKENEFGGTFQQYADFLLEKIGTETNGESLGIHFVDEETGETTVNLGVVEFNEKECSFTLDIRYPKNADPEVVDDRVINEINSYGLDVLKKTNAKLLYVPKDSELVSKLVKVYEAETQDCREPIAIGGGTYAKEFPNMVAFGPAFPGEEDVIHQPNERVQLDKMMKSYQIIAAAMYELAQKNG